MSNSPSRFTQFTDDELAAMYYSISQIDVSGRHSSASATARIYDILHDELYVERMSRLPEDD